MFMCVQFAFVDFEFVLLWFSFTSIFCLIKLLFVLVLHLLGLIGFYDTLSFNSLKELLIHFRLGLQFLSFLTIFHTLGLEVASYMTQKNVSSVHVLVRGECPLENVFGKKVGSVFKKVTV